MNKYLYYNGKIYEIDKLEHHTIYKYRPDGNKNIWEEYYIDDKKVSELVHKEESLWFEDFNDFENLIQSGDIIEFLIDIKRTTKAEVLGFGTLIYNSVEKPVVEIYDSTVYYEHIEAIWKQVNGIYTRVCHKEDRNWVID